MIGLSKHNCRFVAEKVHGYNNQNFEMATRHSYVRLKVLDFCSAISPNCSLCPQTPFFADDVEWAYSQSVMDTNKGEITARREAKGTDAVLERHCTIAECRSYLQLEKHGSLYRTTL